MSNLEKILRDVGYFGVGAAATVVEAGSKVIKALVDKGEETLRDNQDTVDEIVRKAKEFGEKVKDTVEKATSCGNDAKETEAAEPCCECETAEGSCECETAEPCCECEAAEEEAPAAVQADTDPVVPDVIYRTAEPVAEAAAEPEVVEVPEEAPVAEVPAEEEPAEPVVEVPVMDTPVEEEPAAEAPEAEVPVMDAEQPVVQKAYTEAPVMNIPDEEKPAEEKPAPAKSTPSEIPVLNIPDEGNPKDFLNRY